MHDHCRICAEHCRSCERACNETVRETGYDSALDELDYGIVSVADRVFDTERRILAAINCSTSTTRISQDELVRTRLPMFREAAAEIEGLLAMWPALHCGHSARELSAHSGRLRLRSGRSQNDCKLANFMVPFRSEA